MTRYCVMLHASCFPGKLDEENVSIVSVSGKDNICELVPLVLKLGIECYLLADFDFLLRDKLTARNKYGAKAHDSLASLPSEYFAQLPSVKDGKKLLVYINQVRSYLKKFDEKAFYTAKQVGEFSQPNLPKMLKELRRGGIGILDGELEGAVLDSSLLSEQGKLDLWSLQEIKTRITDGQSLSKLFDLSQLREFLFAALGINDESRDLLAALQSLRKKD
jgi:putative ATP-dependent endonuclease of the OLD family